MSRISAITPETKALVLERAGRKCEGCGLPAERQEGNRPGNLFMHHIIRLADGGSDEAENLALLCKSCHWGNHRGEESPRGLGIRDELRRKGLCEIRPITLSVEVYAVLKSAADREGKSVEAYAKDVLMREVVA